MWLVKTDAETAKRYTRVLTQQDQHETGVEWNGKGSVVHRYLTDCVLDNRPVVLLSPGALQYQVRVSVTLSTAVFGQRLPLVQLLRTPRSRDQCDTIKIQYNNKLQCLVLTMKQKATMHYEVNKVIEGDATPKNFNLKVWQNWCNFSARRSVS